MLSVRLENPQSNFRVMNQGKAADASTQEADRMRYYYDKRFGNDLGSLLRQRVPYLEWMKKPLRPFRRALFSLLKRPHYEERNLLATGYEPSDKPLDSNGQLAVAFHVADRFMVDYNLGHPAEFLFEKTSRKNH